MNEFEKYPELLLELEKHAGIKETLVLAKTKHKANREYTRKHRFKFMYRRQEEFNWKNLIKHYQKGFDLKYHEVEIIACAPDIYSYQLMQYLGVKMNMNIFLKRFDIRSVSLYILERYWDDIVTVIYKPQFMNSPIYTCTRMEIFRFLLKKGVHVDDIVYPQKYDHRKSLYTYDIVLEYWYHHTNRKQNTKKQNLENLDKWNDIKFIINEFDNFREETYFACKGIQFIIPKWFLYFYVYFKPIKDYAGFDKSYVPFVSSSSVEAFFDLISDLDIKHTSSSGVNLFMMLLDSSIEDMIKGCELLLKFGLNPLKKDIEGRSFFDILLSKENKYSKVIELIKREVNLNSFSQTKIELDISAKTRVYPLPRTMDNTFSQDSTKLVEKKPNPISRRNQKENDLIQSIDLKKSTIQNIMQETIYKDNALLELIFSNVIKSK